MAMTKKLLPALLLLINFTAHADPAVPVQASNQTKSPAPAQPSTPLTAEAAQGPDGSDFPMLAQVLQTGGKTFYLGKHDGLDGWLIVQDNREQLGYATPDHKALILGPMIGPSGYDITQEQLKELSAENPAAREEMAAISKAIAAAAQNADPGMGGLQRPQIRALGSPNPNMPASVPTSMQAPTPSKPSEAALKNLIDPADRLAAELDAASSVTIGSKDAPLLYMVMDPDCPHCQATWKVIGDAVLKNNLRIRMVPLGNNEAQERAAGQLLTSSDALKAWDKYVGGDKSQLAGTPSDAVLQKIRANHVLADRWNIKITPYMLYRSKSGEMKIVAGEPKDGAAFLSDIGP